MQMRTIAELLANPLLSTEEAEKKAASRGRPRTLLNVVPPGDRAARQIKIRAARNGQAGGKSQIGRRFLRRRAQ